MPYEFFNLEKSDGMAKVTINRPPSNAMSVEFIDEFRELLTELKDDSKIRAVLFRSGLPKYFMTGADLRTIPPDIDLSDIDPNLPPVEVIRQTVPRLIDFIIPIFSNAQAVINQLESLPKPTVVLIGGHALGGGLELCLACDFRIMARGPATIGLTEVNLGLLPTAGGAQRLNRILGRGKTIELILLGKRINADEAEAIGLIYRAVDPEVLEEEGEKMALDLAQRATVSIGKAKQCIYKGEDLPLEEALRMEREFLRELLDTEDIVEGVLSFTTGKKPEFKGC